LSVFVVVFSWLFGIWGSSMTSLIDWRELVYLGVVEVIVLSIVSFFLIGDE